MRTKKVTLELTLLEATALAHAASAGTVDETVYCLGFSPQERAAYRRAELTLARAIMAAQPERPLSERARTLLENAIDCDGIEVHREDWEAAQELVDKGRADLGPARGPDRGFRRLTPKQ